MTATSKREYLGKVRERYRRAGRGYKARILDEFCVVCGYEREWAIRLLNRRLYGPAKRAGPTATYGPELFKVLKVIWLASGQMCGKRFKEALPLWVPHYRGEFKSEARALLLAASAATLDRLLAPARMRYGRRGMGGTKPGALLKTQIPNRTVFLQKHKDIIRLLKAGQSVRNAAKITDRGVSTVQRVKKLAFA